MDTSHWPQVIGVVKAPMEGSTKQPNNSERRTTTTRAHQKDQVVNCPRCNSTNTKFCYYNNYSLTQPRYFCKTCRRYWTEGGSLRNVPVGGGSRKNKRPSPSSSSSSSSSNKKASIIIHHDQDHGNHNIPLLPPPSLINFPLHHHHQGQDLNLTYPPTSSDHHHHHHHHHNMSFVNPSTITSTTVTTTTTTTTNAASPTSSSSPHVSAMELLKSSASGIANSRGLMMGSFMPMPVLPDNNNNHHHQLLSSFANLGGQHEFKPSLISFGLDHAHADHHQYHHQGGGYSNGSNNNNSDTTTSNVHGHSVVQDTASARLLFPSTTEDLKQVSNDHHQDHDRSTHHQFQEINNRGQGDSSTNNVYNWNGMLGGGSW